MAVRKKHCTFASAIQKYFYLQYKNAPVAQLVEHLTLNQGVQGSSPCGCTKEENVVMMFSSFHIYLDILKKIFEKLALCFVKMIIFAKAMYINIII